MLGSDSCFLSLAEIFKTKKKCIIVSCKKVEITNDDEQCNGVRMSDDSYISYLLFMVQWCEKEEGRRSGEETTETQTHDTK